MIAAIGRKALGKRAGQAPTGVKVGWEGGDGRRRIGGIKEIQLFLPGLAKIGVKLDEKGAGSTIGRSPSQPQNFAGIPPVFSAE